MRLSHSDAQLLKFPISHVLTLSLVLLAACGSPFAETPPVADSTLVNVLAELHLAEAHEQMRRQGQLAPGAPTPGLARAPDSTTAGVPPALRDSILAYYGTTPAELQAALDYYARHPEQYTDLYDRVLDRLNAGRAARASPSR